MVPGSIPCKLFHKNYSKPPKKAGSGLGQTFQNEPPSPPSKFLYKISILSPMFLFIVHFQDIFVPHMFIPM